MQPVPFDDSDELLFIRMTADQVDGEHAIPAVVDLPDWSANRERFSEPDDVLLGYPDHTHIGQFRVGDIPPKIDPDPPSHPKQPAADPWEFWAEHDPLPDNDAHSEVRMRKEGEQYFRGKKIGSRPYKKKVRTELSKIIRVQEPRNG